ncbi:M23 family metallopeptidase [Sanguibacter sp. HDW7]|uniref:M23 family metallopeptidase n=1 Tax=Sanguibacter sp. HDW7 TaxID=2714931 RepID=UPI00140E6884|nr:M23 family metallopeptidase [Sanguibacter sp. HDW7]QIK83235.1 M23 family metallopeptidase [Sanguibacter sp. HDW7]
MTAPEARPQIPPTLTRSGPLRRSSSRVRLVAALGVATLVCAPAASAARSPAATTSAPDPVATALPWRTPVTGTVARTAQIPSSPWASGHRGLDMLATPGVGVVAPADGIVGFVGRVAGRGVVVLEHDGGLRSSFEPVSTVVTVGTRVAAGDVVARVDGAPGHCAPLTCLHWGVRLGERYLDPAALLARPRIVLMPLRA